MKSENRFIYHFTEQDTFERSKLQSYYAPQAFERDGFIHCSTRDQVLRVANLIAPKDTELVLLRIDTTKVSSTIVYENLEGGEVLFPHIYGQLEHHTIDAAEKFEADSEGGFQLPSMY